MRKSKFLHLIGVGCLALTIAGCGDDKPATYPVTGKVTLNGKPVADATITFVGEPPENSAATRTKSDGTYEIATYEAGDGALPGEYKVMVTKINKGDEVSPYDAPPEDAEAVEQTPEAISEAYSKAYSGPPKGGWQPPKVTNDLPIKYASVATSGLQIQVVDKPVTYDIELKSR